MSILRGVVPPVLTPFHADGSLDLSSLDSLVEHLIGGGVHGLFVLGSSGQVAYLTDAERDTVVEHVIATAAGRVPVMVGTPDLTARRVLDHARRAQSPHEIQPRNRSPCHRLILLKSSFGRQSSSSTVQRMAENR